MSLFVEDSFWVFFFMTVVIGGGAAIMAGRALASKWRPIWMAVLYMIPLAMALRFFHYALFQGTLTSVQYWITDTLILVGFALLGYRFKRVRQMTRQYPWLYEKSSPFTWKEKKA